MMDDSGYKLVDIDSNIVVDDWLAESKSDIQPQVGNTRMENVRIRDSSPDLNNLRHLHNVPVELEEMLHQDAASKSVLMSRIAHKVMPKESLYYDRSSTSSAVTQTPKADAAGLGSSLQNLSAYSHDCVGNLAGQTMQSSIFFNARDELPRSRYRSLQQVIPQQQHQPLLQQQLLKQNVQQPHIHSSLLPSNIQYSHRRQEEQQTLSLPTELQSSQQSKFSAVHDQRQIGQDPNATILQQHRQLALLEKQQEVSPYQQNMLTTLKQSLEQQSNVFGLQQQQQQQSIVAQSDMLKMQPNQHALHILQQPEVAAPRQNVQQASQLMQLRQLLGLQKQSNSLQETMQKRCQIPVSLLNPNDIIDQQNQLEQSQRLLPLTSSASADSTCQIEFQKYSDWHDQAYHELESMREMYLPEVIMLYKRACKLSLQPPSIDLATKCEKTRIFIEKTMKFLQMTRADIVHWTLDKFYHHLKLIKCYLRSVRSKNPVSAEQCGQQQDSPGSQSQKPQPQQQINMEREFHPANAGSTSAHGGPPQLSTRLRIPNSQANKINFVHNGSSSGSEPKNAPSTLQHGSIHQYTMSRMQQTNLISSLHNVSLNGREQRNAADLLLHDGVRSSHPNTLSTLQHTNFSHMTTVNALDPTTRTLPSNSTTPFLSLKQQPKHQMMQAQILKQPQQQPLIEQKKKQMFMQNMFDINEAKVGQIEFCSGMLQEPHLMSVHMNSPQSLLPSTNFNSESPQISQHSSSHIDQKNLSPLSKAAASQLIIPSPSTPLTPSSLPMDPERNSSSTSRHSVEENTEYHQTPVGVAQATIENQSVAIGTPEILASPLPEEFTNPEDGQQTRAKEPSLKCLLEVVESISPGALSASVRDINSVINMIDRIARTTPTSESRVATGDDLAADTSHYLQGRNFSLHCRSTSSKWMKYDTSTTSLDFLSSPLNESDGLEQSRCQTTVETTATSRIKRPRTDFNYALLEEIKEINLELVETVIDVVLNYTEDTGFGEGTIVRCSSGAVGLSGNLKLQSASLRMLPIDPVRFLVPADYPNSSPILLNAWPSGRSEAGELETPSEKAKSRFSLSLRKLPQPVSLGVMARTWEFCVHTVLSEFFQSMGGGSFSSTYGTWENCITAA